MRNRLHIRAMFASTALTVIGVPAAWAQSADPVPAPPRQSIDANGVDLFDGTFVVSGPSLSIGAAGGGALEYRRISRNGAWGDTVTATLQRFINNFTVSLGAVSDGFLLSGTNYVSSEGNGSTLSFNSTTNEYTYTRADGTTIIFAKGFGSSQAYANEGRVTTRISPQGARTNYTYASGQYCIEYVPNEPGTCRRYATIYRLANVVDTAGYTMTFAYLRSDMETVYDASDWSTVTRVTARNLAVDTPPDGTWPSQSFARGAGGVNRTDAITNAGETTRFVVASSRIVGIRRPGKTVDDVTIGYANNRVATVATPAGTTSYAINDTGANRTVTVTNPLVQPTTYVFDIASRRPVSVTTPLGATTSYSYDSNGRLQTIRLPEGNLTTYTYDLRGNVTRTTVTPKPGSPLPAIVLDSSYAAACTNALTCNQPVWTRDAKGAQTDYTYDPTHGGVTAVTPPAPTAGAPRPQTRYGYAPFQAQYKNPAGAIVASGYPTYLLTSVSQCSVGASCAGTANETRTTVDYGPQTAGVANNLLPVSVTTSAGDNSLVAPTAFTYDAIGNRITVDGPLGTALNDVSRVRYDAARRVVGAVGPDPDGPGAMKSRAQRVTYNGDGQPTLVEAGTVETQSDADWANFTSLQQVASVYDADGRKAQDTITAGGTTYGVTQYSYDAAGRSDCSAVRLNPAAYGALPASACTPGAAGADGPDRISKLVYDATGRVTSQISALGAGAAFETEEKLSYTLNGQVDTVTDGNGNVTNQDYDGFDRASVTYFPSPTAPGTSNGGDYEQLSYDANGNVTQRRLRDGNVINYGYDALNRMIAKDRPELGYNTDLTYAYDLLGRVTSSTGNWLPTTAYAYDALGRLLSETNPWTGTTSWAYDVAGRKTRQTWSDGQYVNYTYLRTGEMSAIRDAANVALVTFLYDAQGRRTNLNRVNGAKTAYAYDAGSRLTQLTQNLLATAQDLTLGFTYTAAGQIKTRTSSNNAYAWTKHYNADRPYGVNGLNQLTAAGTAPLGYDARGNLTTSNGVTYGYNGDNQLVNAPGTSWLVYDNTERLFHVSSEESLFAYDGGDMIAEYDSYSRAIRRRYVFGPNADEPLIWYEGAGMTDRRFFHADERGSVIAVSDASGAATNILSYDEYGIPGAGNGTVRFQYTGQKWIPGLGMYDYKARMYSPTLGRFMQTDPIGYGDGLNWYNYVGGDPVNGIDPSGLAQGVDCSENYCTPTIPEGDVLVVANRPVSPALANAPRGPAAGSNSGGASGGQGPQNKQCPAPTGGPSAIPRGAGAKSFSEAAAIARQIANQELARTRSIAPAGAGHNDIYDAERHSRWVYRMAVAVGSGWAGLFATGHEGEGMVGGQPFSEMQMDLSNNSLGLNAAVNGSGIPTRSTPGLTYMQNGNLVRRGC